MQSFRYTIIGFWLLTVLNVAAQQPELVLQKGHQKKINALHLNRAGNQLLSTGEDGIIKVWDPYSQKLIAEMGGHGVIYSDASYSADEKYVIAIPADKTFGMEVWSLETNKLIFNSDNGYGTQKMSPHAIYGLDYPNKGSMAQTVTRDSIPVAVDHPITIYAIKTAIPVRQISNFENGSTYSESFVEFLTDTTLLVAQQLYFAKEKKYGTRYHIYDFISNRLLGSFGDTSASPKKGVLCVSPGKRFFLRYNFDKQYSLFSDDGYTELWDLQKREMVWSRPIRLLDYSFGNNDSTLVIANAIKNTQDPYLRNVMRFNLKAGHENEAQLLKEIFPGDLSVCSSEDGNSFVVENTVIKDYENDILHKDTSYKMNVYNEQLQLKSTLVIKKLVTAKAFTANNNQLMVGYEDGDFSVWDTQDSIAEELSSQLNVIDPVLGLHPAVGNKKTFYTTRHAFGFRNEDAFSNLSFFQTEGLPVKNLHFLQGDQFSILDAGAEDAASGKLYLINNLRPELVTHFSYLRYGESKSAPDSLPLINIADQHSFKIPLKYPGLKSLSLVTKTFDFGFGHGAMMRPSIDFTYAIMHSTRRVDTTFLFANMDNLKYNEALKGFTFFYDAPYLINKSFQHPIKSLAAAKGNSYLNDMVISENGERLLGLLSYRAVVEYPDYYYCQDLKGNILYKTPVGFKGDSIGALLNWYISPDKKLACLLSDPTQGWGGNIIRIINAQNGNPLFNLKKKNTGAVLGVTYSKDNQSLFAWYESGTCSKWDLKSGLEIYTIVFFMDHDYAIILPNGYYYISSRTDARYLNFKLNNRLYNFGQFDMQFNRPDLVLKAIGSNDIALETEYYNAWKDRIQKAGFIESDFNGDAYHVPEIILQSAGLPTITDLQSLPLQFSAIDALYPLKSYNVFINDVPLFGINGHRLNNKLGKLPISVTVLLNEGQNKIEISCTNEKGINSKKELFYCRYTKAVKLTPHTYFIGIGINQYSAHSSFVDLHYCVKDIRDLTAAFRDKFKESLIVDTLINEAATRENILALKKRLLQTDVDDKVIISFSGHGMVDLLHPGDFYFVTGNTDVNNPAVNGVSYADLETLLDSIPARKKLMLLDACHSGEADDNLSAGSQHIPGTKKGMEADNLRNAGSVEVLEVVDNHDPNHHTATDIFKLMKEAFVDIRRNNGAYVLSAAQNNEAAGEGGGISNGWFSACLIESLRHAGTITVNGLNKSVSQCVLAKSAGSQNTDTRQELAEADWKLW